MREEELFKDEDIVDEQIQVCWRDNNRACGTDCVAYDDRSINDARFKPCIMINVQRQQSNALANLSNTLKSLLVPVSKMFEQFQKFRQKQVAEDLPGPPEIKL